MNKRVHNFLMSSKSNRELYTYGIDGIYFNHGYLKGKNLSKHYREDSEKVLDYLESIIDNDASSYKMKVRTKEVILDLKNNYPNYEF